MSILRIHRLNVMWAFVHASNKDIPDSIDKIRAIVTYEDCLLTSESLETFESMTNYLL